VRPVDYIHYNPVKHGMVQRVADWPFSNTWARRFGMQTHFPDASANERVGTALRALAHPYAC
jgi:putative transposase